MSGLGVASLRGDRAGLSFYVGAGRVPDSMGEAANESRRRYYAENRGFSVL